MGIRVTNLTEVITMLQMTDRNVTQGVRDAMMAGAELVKDDAIDFAPVLTNRLESAIKIQARQGNQYMSRIVIGVSGVVDGKSVDRYAAIVHEYPWDKRGPLTRLKGPQAGPRYLKRALENNKKEIEKMLKEALEAGIGRAIAKSGVNRTRSRRR